MSDSISACYDEAADYRRLCEKYHEKPHKDSERSERNPRRWVVDGAEQHYWDLQKRETFEKKAHTNDANAQNVARYLGEATVDQLCAEIEQRGYNVRTVKREVSARRTKKGA